jgi:translocation and assembly module TamA
MNALGLCASAVLVAAVGLTGCAQFQRGPGAASAEATPAPSAPVLDVSIDAPDDLAALLRRHLDITRLATLPSGETLDDTEIARLQRATPAQARDLLATEGYVEAEVTVTREPPLPTGTPRLAVAVKPGVRARVARVSMEIRGPLAQSGEAAVVISQWRETWTLPQNRPFTNTAWRDAKNNALARLRALGYIQAAWVQTNADIDAATGEAALSVEADSGPLFLTGDLVIEGLERQDRRSVARLADFTPGTPATESLLLDYQERLQRSNLFERVSVTLEPDPAKPSASPVIVRVSELPLQQATVSAGVSGNTGPRLGLEHLHRRIGGQRATLRNKIEWGRLRQAWEGELSSHALPGLHRHLLGGTAERLLSDTDEVNSLRLRLGRAYEAQRIERLWFFETERVITDPRDGGPSLSRVTAASANFHGIWRDVDSVVLPTKGQVFALESALGQVTSARVGGSGGFGRLHLRTQFWRPLGLQWYGQARADVGVVLGKRGTDVPQTQLFRTGGDDTVRGYEYRSLALTDASGVDTGGRVMAAGSVEVARPVSPRLANLWWALFIDGGNVAERWSDLSPAWGAGVGLRWRSPVGPLRADLAYGEEVKKWRLHLSVGIAF